MSDHEHAGNASSAAEPSTCGLSPDAASGPDDLLQNVLETVSGAFSWFFAQDENTAAQTLESAVEEGGGEIQDDAAEEALGQTNIIDENTIPPPPANAEIDEQDKTSTPTKAATTAPITSEDTVASNSSASSDDSTNKKKKEQRSSRTKLVGVVAVGLVLIMAAVIVGAVIGTSGNSGENTSVHRLQGANTMTTEETDFYLGENDGGDMEVVDTSTAPGQQSSLPTDRPSLRPTPTSADDTITIQATPLPIDGPPGEAADYESTSSSLEATTPLPPPIDGPTDDATENIPTSFSFYVVGDVPYNENQKIIVQDQILQLSDDIVDEDLFLIHVGDAMNARQGCKEKDFVFMRDLLTLGLPELPSFIIPGDK